VNGLTRSSSIHGAAVLTWAHRNRLQQTAVIRQDDPGDATPEGTYTLKVFVGGVEKRSVSGLTDPAWFYTAAQRIQDGSKAVEIRIQQVTAAGSSVFNSTGPFQMTGFGMGFGQAFGGKQA